MRVRIIHDNLHLVRLIIEKVKSKAFDKVGHCFLEPVLMSAISLLDPSLVYAPGGIGGSRRDEVRDFHFVPVHWSGLSAYANALRSCLFCAIYGISLPSATN